MVLDFAGLVCSTTVSVSGKFPIFWCCSDIRKIITVVDFRERLSLIRLYSRGDSEHPSGVTLADIVRVSAGILIMFTV